MRDLSSYFKYRSKLSNAQMAFSPHLLTTEMLKEINSIFKAHKGHDLKEIIADINYFQYQKLMDKHFKNLLAIERLESAESMQGRKRTNEEEVFIDMFGLDNVNLKSSAIYLPNGQVLTNPNDKNFIKTLMEEKSYMVVNASPYRLAIQVKDENSNAKITASNPIENRHKNPTITTEVTRGNVSVTRQNTFDNTYYDVCKADPKSANLADFILEEKTVNNLNIETSDEMERN